MTLLLTTPSAQPLPAALPLFAGGLSLFGGVGYWRKRRQDKVNRVGRRVDQVFIHEGLEGPPREAVLLLSVGPRR